MTARPAYQRGARVDVDDRTKTVVRRNVAPGNKAGVSVPSLWRYARCGGIVLPRRCPAPADAAAAGSRAYPEIAQPLPLRRVQVGPPRAVAPATARHPLGARSPRARSRPQRPGPQSPAPARPRNGWQPIGQSGHHRTTRPCSTMTPSVLHAGRESGRSLSCPCSGGSVTGARGASVVLQGADADSGPVVDPLRCAQRPREG